MTERYYFVGAYSQVGDMEFSAVGQVIELEPEQYANVLRGGAAFLPQAEFDSCGFTPEELALHGPYFIGEPSAEFKRKVAAARELVNEARALVG